MTKTFIGTFGVSDPIKSKVFQPIEAIDEVQACVLMNAEHGYEWSTVYTLADYKALQDKGLFKGHQPLRYLGGIKA